MKPRFHSSALIAVAAGAAAWLGSLPALARDKAEPAPQWAVDAAKTPTPSTANSASAVVLFDEYLITVDAENHAIERERFAVRILKPQGRKYANCRLEYDSDEKLDSFRSWTIASDGRQFQAKETDFMDVGAYADRDMQSAGYAVDLDFAVYRSSVTARGNILHYEREYVVRPVAIPPAKATAFRQLESTILADEKGVAVLRRQ
jgi:hypothetical protein